MSQLALAEPSRAVSPAHPGQYASIAQVIARAFQDDPFYSYVIPDPTRRASLLPWLFLSWLRYNCITGHNWVSAGEEGATLWRSPGRYSMNFWHEVRAGMLATPFKLNWGEFGRLTHAGGELECRAMKLMSGPFWYCWILAVAPERQGQGHGWALMQHAFSHANVPCYLETGTEQNVRRYIRYGYRVLDEYLISNSDLRMWSLVRDPC